MPEGKSMLDPVKPEDSYSAKTHLHQAVSNPPEVATGRSHGSACQRPRRGAAQ